MSADGGVFVSGENHMRCDTAAGMSDLTGERELPTVLLPDYNGFWSELANLYWSQPTASLISRHPLSSTEELLSLFCPQCLNRYSDDEAQSTGGFCTSCAQCPCCSGVIPINTSVLICSTCGVKITGFNCREDDIQADHFRALVNSMSSKSNGVIDIDLSRSTESWQLENLHAKLQIEAGDEVSKREQLVVDDIQHRVLNLGVGTRVLPRARRVSLLSKRTLRSKQDVGTGKLTMLVQPKPLPLEGDSSLKLSRGKWWGVDASAVHELPFVSIMSLPTAADLMGGSKRCAVQLVISNPKVSEITIAFTADEVVAPSAGDGFLWLDRFGTAEVCKCHHNLLPSTQLCAPEKEGIVQPNVLRIVLSSFEDEWLKETGEEGDPSDGPSGGQCAAAHGALDGNLIPRAWEHVVHRNRATLTIPVSLGEKVGVSAGLDPAGSCGYFQLDLQCTVDLGEGPAVAYPLKVIFS